MIFTLNYGIPWTEQCSTRRKRNIQDERNGSILNQAIWCFCYEARALSMTCHTIRNYNKAWSKGCLVPRQSSLLHSSHANHTCFCSNRAQTQPDEWSTCPMPLLVPSPYVSVVLSCPWSFVRPEGRQRPRSESNQWAGRIQMPPGEWGVSLSPDEGFGEFLHTISGIDPTQREREGGRGRGRGRERERDCVDITEMHNLSQ